VTEAKKRKPRPVLPLTERDWDVLETLRFTNDEATCPRKWATPLDLGAGNGSHHSQTLAKLVRRGLVEGFQRAGTIRGVTTARGVGMSRGSKCYRITDAGREACKEWRAGS